LNIWGRVEQDTVIGYDPVTDWIGFEGTQTGHVVLRQAYAESRGHLFQHATLP
jgi:hypothetical protein